jgi:hypothetical protein
VRTVHRGTWRPEDRAESRYRYLPVDVPPGAQRLTVSLAYDRAAGVLDLGCLAPDGGFRGWSGGARSTFTIGVDWATPGYLPGPLPPGAWRVMLGLHRVQQEGLTWTVTAETSRSVPDPPGVSTVSTPVRTRSRNLPAPPGLTWLAGDLPCTPTGR